MISITKKCQVTLFQIMQTYNLKSKCFTIFQKYQEVISWLNVKPKSILIKKVNNHFYFKPYKEDHKILNHLIGIPNKKNNLEMARKSIFYWKWNSQVKKIFMIKEFIWKIRFIPDKKAIHNKDCNLKVFKISLRTINIIKQLFNQMKIQSYQLDTLPLKKMIKFIAVCKQI